MATRLNPTTEVVLLRLQTTGAVDATRGCGDGLVELATPGAGFSGAEDAVVDAAGRIVIAGFARFPDGPGGHLRRITVCRLSASGSLVVAGTSRLFATPPDYDDSFVVWLRPDDSLDPGFGGNGFSFQRSSRWRMATTPPERSRSSPAIASPAGP